MPKYRVLEGAHSEGGKLYRKGDVVESKADLLRLNRSNPPKFARLDTKTGEEVVRQAPQGVHPLQDTEQVKKIHTQESIKEKDKKDKILEANDGYEDLSEKDLRELLEAEEVHLRGNESKAELVKLLRDNS